MGVITTAVGTAITLGAASGATASAIGAGVIGAGVAAAGGLLMKGLSGGGSQSSGMLQAPTFDPNAAKAQGDAAAREEDKRRRVAAAKNETKLSDPDDEAKLGKTGLLGS